MENGEKSPYLQLVGDRMEYWKVEGQSKASRGTSQTFT